MVVQAPSAVRQFLDSDPKRLLIGGNWQDATSGAVFPCVNPSDGTTVAHFAEGGATDVGVAVTAARRAFEGTWSKFKPVQRQDTLLKLADLVERDYETLEFLDIIDMGAPITRIRAMRDRLLETIRYYAGWATKINGETLPNSAPHDSFTYTLKEPVGVVGSIIPWNGASIVAIQRIVPVLAVGSTIVLKLSEEAGLSALRIGELIQELDIPDGVVNIISGFGETAGAALAAHGEVDKINFTGSHLTGQKIVQLSAGNLKRISLELGGKSPDIVFADADFDSAVRGAAMGVFANSGQICVAGSRVFVEREIYEDFVCELSRFASKLHVGNSLEEDTDIGPLVSQRQLRRVLQYLESGRTEGARIVAGGNRVTERGLANGYFVAPTVFADVRDAMNIAQEEVFGPLLSVLPFDDLDEVVRRANSTQFGLAGGVWTSDIRKAHQVANALRAGTVYINCYGETYPAVPFGGYKMSGYGREGGADSLREYLNVKSVMIRVS